MIIYGNRLFGKVDQVPGVGYVATRFFHIDYLPLVPYQSWLVFQLTGKSWKGVKIPLSAKSLLVGWGRTASVLAGIGGAFASIVMISGGRSTTTAIAEVVALTVAGWGFFIFSKMHSSVTRASYKRACELAGFAKLNPAAMADLAKAYGEPLPRGAAVIPPQKIEKIAATKFSDAPAEPIALEEIPVDDPEATEVIEPVVTPLISQASRPRTETRRHG